MDSIDILAALNKASQLIAAADIHTLQEAEQQVRLAAEGLRCTNEKDLLQVLAECRRAGALASAAAEFYSGLASQLAIESRGYGSMRYKGLASQPVAATGRQFALNG